MASSKCQWDDDLNTGMLKGTCSSLCLLVAQSPRGLIQVWAGSGPFCLPVVRVPYCGKACVYMYGEGRGGNVCAHMHACTCTWVLLMGADADLCV